MESESDLVKKMVNHLENYFIVRREVELDIHNRIDLLLQYKKDNDIYFGIEVKRRNQKKGGNYRALIEQANRYSKVEFKNGYLPIMIYPPISADFIQIEKSITRTANEIERKIYYARHSPDSGLGYHHNLNSILGLFNLGEYRILKRDNGYREMFIFENNAIWVNYHYNNSEFNREEIKYDNYERMIKIIKKQNQKL